jgi:ketosteroid isomerase-like protein
MSIVDNDRKLVEDLYKAMQIGPAAEDDLLALFTEDAVLVEPFTGKPQSHAGREAIRASLQGMWQNRAPDLKLVLDRVDLDGSTIRAAWTCTSALLPGPMRGLDILSIQSNKISRLEIVITEMPWVNP